MNCLLQMNVSNMQINFYLPSALYTRDRISLSSGSFTSTCIPIPIETKFYHYVTYYKLSTSYLYNWLIFLFAFYLKKVVQNHLIWNHIVQFCSVLKINIDTIVSLNQHLFTKSLIHFLLVTIVSEGTSSMKHFLSPSAKWKYKPVEYLSRKLNAISK